jgi:tetratricopeptide (TPR) repeat protein
LGRRYYRLALAAAKRRDLTAALRYADFACILDPEHGDAAYRQAAPYSEDASHLEDISHLGDISHLEDALRLAEICRHELGETCEQALEQIGLLVRQKKWKTAAREAGTASHQSVRLLNIQGCLWALAKRYALAADCFTRALAKDRGNILAVDALAELGRRRKYFWRFFCFSLMK